MREKKEFKRAVKSVWERVKGLRSERAKLYGPGDIAASGEALTKAGEELNDLAKQLSALSPMPSSPDPSPAPAKRKRKKAAKG